MSSINQCPVVFYQGKKQEKKIKLHDFAKVMKSMFAAKYQRRVEDTACHVVDVSAYRDDFMYYIGHYSRAALETENFLSFYNPLKVSCSDLDI